MSDTKFIDLIKNKYGDLVLDSHNFRGDQTVTVKKDCGNEFFKFIRDEPFKGHPLRKDYPVNKRQPLIGPLN